MDKTYQRQLEKFGIESSRITEENPAAAHRKVTMDGSANVVRALMDSIEGRQWIYNKLDFYCVFSTPFISGKPDATAFLCGLQEAGHQLQKEVMEAAPERYFEMITEAATRQF